MQILESLYDDQLTMALKQGAVAVMPTDTVYGIVCAADNEAAVGRLYAAKHREHKPGTLIAANVDHLIELGLPADKLHAVEHVWPGPISVELPCGPELFYLHDGAGTVAVRIPDNEKLRAMLLRTGPLLTSSANLPGASPATNVPEALRYFGEAVDIYVDGGETQVPIPSTVIRLDEQNKFIIKRQGAGKISPEDLAEEPKKDDV